MKKFFYALFLLCLPLMAQAEFVSEADAEAIASQFLNANVAAKPGRQNAPSQVRMRKAAEFLPQQHFYIFNSEDGNGFVIVSANDIARPILGYSDEGAIDVNNLPSNMQWWLGEYNAQIEAGIANHIPATEDIQKEWKAFKQGKAQSATAVVGPLLTTQWNQGTPYNDMCPIYTGTTRALSGCVATATAQIMNYHEYPTSGIGSKIYTTNTHQFTLSADFANTTYDWRNMKDSYKDLSSCSQAQKEAVATLMYHVGVASEMNYAADADGESGYKAFLKGKYDICVFDIMMPKKDGFQLAQEVRTVNSEVPIIFLTAKTLKEDILEGFKIGADDYITKPFSMEELVMRIEAILRRVKGKKGKEVTMYKIGKFTFDTQKQVLIADDKPEKLTTKESELLSLLCAHVNEILERNFALKTIWIDDNYFNARSMDVYITKLRKHLKADPSIEIINIHGKGYKLIAPNAEAK